MLNIIAESASKEMDTVVTKIRKLCALVHNSSVLVRAISSVVGLSAC